MALCELRRAASVTTIAVIATVSTTLVGQQQQNVPHAGYVYPAGGRQGTTLRIVIGGQFLDGAASAIVSGVGVDARVVGIDKPLNGQPLTELRDKLQEMQKQPAAPALQQEMLKLRDRIVDSARRNQSPVLSEFVTLDVTIAPSATLGARQLRLNTSLGLTSPLIFVVGQLPEFQERDVKTAPADAELTVALPATVNGRLIPGDIDRVKFPARMAPQYMPGDVDRYRFAARKGQHLLCAVSARDLMPYLADAVPGWFQATLALYDASGRELAYNDDDRFHPDPVLEFHIPTDGEYVVEIRDAIYRGRDDFVYRLSIGEPTALTSVFPRVGGPMPASFDGLPDVREREPNNGGASAQKVKWPAIVGGRIQDPGDWDVFSITGRAGEAIVAEVVARRMDSPLDSVLDVTDAAGRRLARNDDADDKGAGLETHHADSYLRVVFPANGTYFVRVGDIQHHGGPEFDYRLRLSAPRPNFELRVSPSSLNVSGGGTIPVTVTAIRRDGFAGDIGLALASAPAGFVLSGARVPAGEERVRMTLTVPPTSAAAPPQPLSLRIEGRAAVEGKTLVQPAVPADDMMQAFAYHHLVVADDLRVLVSSRGGTRVPARVVSRLPSSLPAGGSATVRVSLPPAYAAFDNIQFALDDPPDGMTLRDAVVTQNVATFVLQSDAAKPKTGTRGNLIVTMSGERVPPANAPNQTRRRVVIGTLPAIMCEIVSELIR